MSIVTSVETHGFFKIFVFNSFWFLFNFMLYTHLLWVNCKLMDALSYQDPYDGYYDRARFDSPRELFERRYPVGASRGLDMGGSRGARGDFVSPPLRREPMPPMPSLPPMRSSMGAMRSSYDAMYSRRSPPRGPQMSRG